MAILGIGNDIVEIIRIERVIKCFGVRFINRILSASECKKYQLHQQPIRFLAKRFAVKEATAKALGTGFRAGLSFNQLEIYNTVLGKPELRFLGYAKEITRTLLVKKVHVTLADERQYVVATVIIEN